MESRDMESQRQEVFTVHDHYEMLMSMALDKQLDAEEEGALEHHLQSCPGCRQRWNLWKSLDAQFLAAPLFEPSPVFFSNVMTALGQVEKRRQRRIWFGLLFLSTFVWLFALAGIAASVGLLFYFGSDWVNSTLLSLEPFWTSLSVLGRALRTAAVGLTANPLSLSALVIYVLFALSTLTGWSRYLRQSTQVITS